jgi:hypothetical protein
VSAHRLDLVRYVGGYGKRTESPRVRLLWSARPRSTNPVPIVSVGGDEPPPQGGGLVPSNTAENR